MNLNKMIPAVLACIFSLCATTFADEREYLWSKGKMPNREDYQIAALKDEAEKGKEPYIEWCEDPPADAPKTDACVILIPGGGYEECANLQAVREMWPEALRQAGVRCVRLVYRTPRSKLRGVPFYHTAWVDAQRAVRLVRSQAAKRGFNPEKIGVMGASAGAHLATLLATSSQTPATSKPVDELDATVPCHVNWAMTFALAYALKDGRGTMNMHEGDTVDDKLETYFKFDEKTAPMCLIHGGMDPYSPLASTKVYRKLREKKVPAELHLHADKGHEVFGVDRAIEFMRQMNFIPPLGGNERITNRFPNDDARASHEKKNLWEDLKLVPDMMARPGMPYLEWHVPKNLKTKAIQIIWAGGAYTQNRPDDFEVAPIRRYLNEKGMTVVTVRYRCPRPMGLVKHAVAWQDAQRAVRMVRSEAVARGLDPNRIGVMGSSAGGHLAIMTAANSRSNSYLSADEIDKHPATVQWAVCFYPAYCLTDGIDQNNTTGGNDDSARLVPEFAFDLDTPPMLFLHGDADGWAAMNSVKVWEQLRRMGIQGSLHTYAREGHCFQRNACPGTGEYSCYDRIWEFLTAKGFNK